MVDCNLVGICASKQYDVLKEMTRGYANVGATKVDCKNLQYDKKAYIGDCDA